MSDLELENTAEEKKLGQIPEREFPDGQTDQTEIAESENAGSETIGVSEQTEIAESENAGSEKIGVADQTEIAESENAKIESSSVDEQTESAESENAETETSSVSEQTEIVESEEIAAELSENEEPASEPIVIAGSENENEIVTAEEIPDPEPDDGKLRIAAKYDLSSREAIKEAVKIMEQEREEKVVRNMPYKNLPAIFKRTYTPQSLKRRILKKIYIPDDRKEVEALFEPSGDGGKTPRLAIPKDAMFSKKEIRRYKSFAKSIKSQSKFRIRLIPLAVLLTLMIFAVSWVIANKNRIVRDFIVATFQAFFQAKTDIDYVSVKILDASITVGGLKVGNKNSVMKNLFEVNRIQLDFDLVQLLKKRFVCENLEASGIAWNTDRKTSCALSDNAPTGSAFSQELQRRLTNSINALKNQAYDLLGGSDVESIIENVKSNINTPEVVQKTIEDMTLLYDKWKDKPAEYEKEIKTFTASVQNLQTINLSSFDIRNPDDIAKLRDALEKITAAIEQGQSLAKTMQGAVNDMKTDVIKVTDMADNVSKTVKHDYDYVVDRLTTITGTLADLKGLMNSALNTVLYNMLGNLYPYVMEGLSMARSMKSDAPKEKKPKKESRRAPGTDFYFTPAYPSFLIKNILISGTGFSCNAREITNNQNVRNIPTTASLTLHISGITHTGKFTLDTRAASKEPLVKVSYTGEGYKMNINGTGIATKCGVPSIDGTALISLSGTADPTGFSAQGSMDLNPVVLTSDGFENELVTKYYNIGLSSIDRLMFGFDVGYQKDTGLYLKLDGNFGEQFSNALKNVVMELGKDAKAMALKKLEEFLNSSENEVLLKAKAFFGIEGDIDLQNMKLSDVQKILMQKKSDIQDMISGKVTQIKEEVTAKVTEKVNEVKDQATAIIEEKTNEVKKTVTDTITSTITNGLGIKKKEGTDDEEDGEKKEGNAASDAINALTGGFLKGFGF